MAGFVKIYGSLLLGSSLMDEAVETRWMFICLAADADETGFVRCQTVGNAARLANLTIEQAEVALAALSSPDPHSTTPDEEGRRIVRVEGGWRIVNHSRYREMRTDRQIKNAERAARWRASQGVTSNARNARVLEVSASPSVVSSVEGGTGGEDDRGEQLLRDSRVALEREFYRLVSEIAKYEPDTDPPDIARTMSSYTNKDGAQVGGKMRPETLSDERLQRSIKDGLAWLEACRGKSA